MYRERSKDYAEVFHASGVEDPRGHVRTLYNKKKDQIAELQYRQKKKQVDKVKMSQTVSKRFSQNLTEEGCTELFDSLYHRHLAHAKAKEEKLERLANEADKEWGKQSTLKAIRKQNERMREKYNISAGYETSDVQTKGYSIHG